MNTEDLKTTHSFGLDKAKLYWICQILGWSSYGIYLIIWLNASEKLTFRSGADVVFTTSCLLLLSHLYRYFINHQGWLKLLFAKLLLRILLASLVLSMLVIPFAALSSLIFDPSKLSTDFQQENIIASVLGGAFLFFCWSICYFLYHYISNYNRSLKWEAMANEFELNRLRSQLNPHFIFNALNSVKVLVDENPDQARDSIDQLSNILRNSLMMGKKKVIPFQEEFAIVKDYLALERTRFEERLQVHFDIDKASLNFKVPPMMLQTLVENGLKHGIAKRKDGGTISVTTKVNNGDGLIIEIRNTGHYKPNLSTKPNKKGGYGLKSTLQRLELLYHQKASFSISNEGEDTVLVRLQLPYWDEHELNVTPHQVAV